MSLLELRSQTSLELPSILLDPLCPVEGESFSINPSISSAFPMSYSQPLLGFKRGEAGRADLRIGILFSGGQAPGGHNVVLGLKKALGKQGTLLGFEGGPGGLLKGDHREILDDLSYLNSGGFDLLGSGRTKIETKEQFEEALRVATQLQLSGLVIVGGDDSNTNAAFLAEYFASRGSKCVVVGIPKTIDGDLKSPHIEASFGFDTASKVYSELVGNLCRDALSAKKYTHFVRLMGRSASHLTLECALQTQANFTILGEEVAHHNLSLDHLADSLVDLIQKRAEKGKHYGVVLIPEGLVEFIPEMRNLIDELNRGALSSASKKQLEGLPPAFAEQLQSDRDPHGNVQVAKIEMEKLLLELCEKRLGRSFPSVTHYFGYEGRCSFPTNFDARYCYALGFVAKALIAHKKSGYIAAIKNLHLPYESWEPLAVPIVSMLQLEERKGSMKPVIAKTLVDLEGAPFQFFVHNRKHWGEGDEYRYPGPIQFFGPKELCDAPTLTLALEHQSPKGMLHEAPTP